MKNTLTLIALVFALLVGSSSLAQISNGFISSEARDMIQICNSFTYLDLYGDDANILPASYSKVYTSPAYKMDNKFQVYSNGTAGVINFRGTTMEQLSWMENLYASMIPVKGEISVNGEVFKYQMGEERESRIHAGYTLAISFFKNDLLQQIQELNEKGIYDIYITGHSQGGAISQLVRAYLHYLPSQDLDKKNNFKVYAFASPMVGNDSFVQEYNKHFVDAKMSYLLNNPTDFVSKLPFSHKDSTFWQNALIEIVKNRDDGNSMKSMAFEAMTFLFQDKILNMAKKMSSRIEAQIFSQIGDVVMPELYDDFNYSKTGNEIEVQPVEYPLELKDPSILENDSLMKVLKRDSDGNFEDKSLYKKQGFSGQHKPYNYYVSILKEYFPEEYELLDQKYFVEPK